MAKQSFKPGALLAPLPVVMVSCSDGKDDNIITIGWTGIINSEPPMTYISVRPGRHSYEIIKNSGEFVINMVSRDLAYACDFCGCKSGKDIDKFAEMHLGKEKCEKLSCPMIAESKLCLECKVIEIKHLGTHDMFMAEIVAVHADESIVKKNGRIALDKADLVSYFHGNYYAMDPRALGSFGYSVMKAKTVKRRRSEGKKAGGEKPHFDKK